MAIYVSNDWYYGQAAVSGGGQTLGGGSDRGHGGYRDLTALSGMWLFPLIVIVVVRFVALRDSGPPM